MMMMEMMGIWNNDDDDDNDDDDGYLVVNVMNIGSRAAVDIYDGLKGGGYDHWPLTTWPELYLF